MFHFRPKKFKKFHKKDLTYKNNVIHRQNPSYGSFIIKSLDFFDFKAHQVSTCKALITKYLKAENKKTKSLVKGYKYFNNSLRVDSNFNISCSLSMPFYPDFTDTAKPRETRMGKGKGNVSVHFFPVKRGKVLFELRNVPEYLALKCLFAVQPKVPAKLKLVSATY